MRPVKAGFVGFGEVNTPREIVARLCSQAVNELNRLGWDVMATGTVSDDEGHADADQAIRSLQGQDMDLLVVCLAGWIPAHTIIRITDKFRHMPILLWGLTGWMEKGQLVTTAPQAGTSGLRQVMQNLGYRFSYVYSTIGHPVPQREIEHFGQAARAAALLRDARIGSMGYRDMLLYGTTADILAMRRELGIEVECFEMLEMVRSLDGLEDQDVEDVVAYCRQNWVFKQAIDNLVLERGARYYLALKKKITGRKYDAVTLIDVDGMKKLEGFPPAIVFMLLADLLDVCTTPENDIIGNATQLMVRFLTGQAAHYMEFYEYFEDRVLIGVPDYVPSSAVQGKVTLLPAKFGLLQESLLNVSKVRDGQVTLLRLIEENGRYTMHMAAGLAVQPRAWQEYGWMDPAPQLPSLEVILDSPVKDFVSKISSQHTIIAYGDITDAMTQLCRLLNIKII